MSRRWKLLTAGLWVAVIALWFPLQRLVERRQAQLEAPTLTMVTPAGAAVIAPPTPLPPATPTPLPTATPTPTDTPSPTVTPSPTPTTIPTLPPALTPEIAADGRIDAVGPLPLATIAPLALGEGHLPARLRIPKLGLDTPVQPMGWHLVEDANGARSEWDVVDFAAGHHINTAYPGEVGNVVISGHNNIGGAVFRSVCVIGEPGVDFGLEDEILLDDEIGRVFTYRVSGWRRIAERNASIATRLDNARWMDPTDFPQLTLVTCWPPWSNTHRVVVTALLTDMTLP